VRWPLIFNFFISGIVIGTSSCALSCGWLLIPLISENEPSIKKSFFRFIYFHAGKIISYIILGGLVGYSSQFITKITNNRSLWLYGGTILFVIGILNMLLPDYRRTGIKKKFSAVTGFIVGIIPCGPLIGFLVYLAYVANDFVSGAIGGFVFGLGNILNPLIFLIFLVPASTGFFERIINNKQIFKIAGSLIFFCWAIALILEAMG
jgi:sulfite exporter TauE/SafE